MRNMGKSRREKVNAFYKSQNFRLFDIIDDDLSKIDNGDFGFNKSTKIVRYISCQRYLDMIEDERGYNALSLVTMWDDPFEAFLLRGSSDYEETKNVLYSALQEYYGQSWMLKDRSCESDGDNDELESDVLWRAYCTNRDGVRIETTMEKLIKHIRNVTSSFTNGKMIKIGRIKYYEKSELKHFIDMEVEDNLMESLFVKRREFKDENEIRLVVKAKPEFVKECNGRKDDSIRFVHGTCQLKGCGFIEKVLLDPRMTRQKAEEIICRTFVAADSEVLEREIKGCVKRSDLYEWPEFATAFKSIGGKKNENYKLWALLHQKYPHSKEFIDLSGRTIPYDSYWSGLPTGFRGSCFAFISNKKVVRVELYMNDSSATANKKLCQWLESRKEDLEDSLNDKLKGCAISPISIVFDLLENRIASRVYVEFTDYETENIEKDTIIDWFCKVMPKFVRVIKDALVEYNGANK